MNNPDSLIFSFRSADEHIDTSIIIASFSVSSSTIDLCEVSSNSGIQENKQCKFIALNNQTNQKSTFKSNFPHMLNDHYVEIF